MHTATDAEMIAARAVKEAEDKMVDAGNVLILMTTADGTPMPIPLPAVFEQLFGVLNDIDERLMALEQPQEEKSRIITV